MGGEAPPKEGNAGSTLTSPLPPPLQCETTAAISEASATVERTFYEDTLLPYSLQCIHPRLREAVEVRDRAAILRGTQLLLELGTPDEVRQRVSLQQEEPNLQSTQPPQQEQCLTSPAGLGNGGETDVVTPLEPAHTAPATVYATLHEADEELERRCVFFLSTFTERVEAYHVPYDVQRRVVPLLYAWLVDWDFVLRNTKCWESVAECFSRVVQSRRRRLQVRPDFTLPWRPLVELLMSLFFQSGRVMEMHAFNGVRMAVGRRLERVCEYAALHFGADALAGLWETFAPYFSPEREEAPLMLCLLSHLIPVHRLVDDDTGAPLQLTERIVKFFLADSLYWQQQSGNWMAYSLKIVFNMFLHHVGVMDFDKYAEPLFSMMLLELRLPIVRDTAVPHRRLGFDMLGKISLFHIDRHEMASAEGFVGNMLPRRTDSPLWNHLRRFILATSVYLRPNATDFAVLNRVFVFYGSLVAVVHRRRRFQARYEYTLATQPSKLEGRLIPEEYLWDREAMECFVKLVAPVLLSSLHHRLHDAPRVIGLLASLSPTTLQPLILSYVNAGLRSRAESPGQRIVALRLLTKSLYPLSECSDTREECWSFIADVLPLLLPWVNPSELEISSRVLDLIFTACSVANLRNLLGGQDEECVFAVTLVERIFDCCSHVVFTEGNNIELLVHVMRAISLNVSDETFTCCITRALKETEAQDTLSKACAVSCLLQPLARRAPERVLRWAAQSLMQPLQSASTPDGEVQWCAHLLAGCVRGAGLAAFAQRHELLRCIQCLVSQITKQQRVLAAATLYSAVYAAFTEVVCTDARAVQSPAPKTAESASNVSDTLEYNSTQDAYEVSIGFCRSSTVQLVWREASQEHVTYVSEMYRRFVFDIVDIIHGIEHVVPPALGEGSGGLRQLLFVSKGDSTSRSKSKEKYNNNTDNNVNYESGEETTVRLDENCDPFTPQNVLRGVLLWLRIVLDINRELRTQQCVVEAPNMMPWWMQNPKAPWLLPLPPSLLSSSTASSSLPWSQEAVHDLLLEHTLRRVAGGMVDGSVIAAALQLDRSLVMKGKPPLDDSHSTEVDARSLRCVLSILAEQCNIDIGAPLKYDHYRMINQDPDIFERSVVETLTGRRYFPTMYWRMKAESFTCARRSLLLHAVPPKCLTEVLSVAHILLFSPYRLTQADCRHLLIECMPLLGRKAVRDFLEQHLLWLERIAALWTEEIDTNGTQTHHQEIGTADTVATIDDDDAGDGSSSEGVDDMETVVSPTNHSHINGNSNNTDATKDQRSFPSGREGAVQRSSQVKSTLSSALSLAAMGFKSPHFLYDSDLILHTYEMMLQFPEHLSLKRVGNCINAQKTASLSGLSPMENARAVRLCDELLALTVRFANAAPIRALSCLMMVVALYRPSRLALLSPHSVSLLFRLSVNSHEKLRVTSFHILQTVLLSLKEPHAKAYVVMRRGALEDEGNVAFFRHRYEVLRRECPTFYGLRDMGLVFIPKALRIDAEYVSMDMFNDGEAVTVPAELVVLRKVYTEAAEVNARQQAKNNTYSRQELITLISHLSGIIEEQNLSIEVSDHLDSAAETKLRKGWMWDVMQLCHEQKTFSQCRMRMWKALGKLLGVEPSVRMFIRIVRLRLSDYVELARGDSVAARESPQWLFACLADVLVAAVRVSKRHPAVRAEALKCYQETLMFVCTSSLVPHEVLSTFVQTTSALTGTLTAAEVWSLYKPLFATLTPPNETTARNPLTADGDVDDSTTSEAPWWLGRTQEMVRVLTVMVQLVYVFSYEINVVLLPQLCQQIMANKDVFLYCTPTRIRRCAAGVIHQIMRMCLHQSVHIPSNVDVQDSVVNFIDRLERLVELPPLPPLEPLPTLAPWSETPALTAKAHPFMSGAVAMTASAAADASLSLMSASSPLWSDAFSLDGGRGASPCTMLLTVKTFALCWPNPPAPLLNMRVKNIITILARALDIPVTEVDDLGYVVQYTLCSIADVRLPKNTIHGVVELLCEILEEKKPYGKSRQAKVILSHMLCLVLFNNLHRIGKFSVMQAVTRAAMQSIGHGDGRVRSEGRVLLAVLTRVASVDQAEALVQGCFLELRDLTAAGVPFAATSGSNSNMGASLYYTLEENVRRRRRIALLLGLCSILCASPGAVPKYVPRLMERLAACAHDPALEVRRGVKRAFEEWWLSHREGWELEHKQHFTAAQIEVMSPLFTAPMYLV
ncbi:hypothetical protein DQ04_02891000 [Trypanosoma grayi]|uniref:hypothetical protein n=1 Tax=Trypanosoma grayi TaxID=71804 RepID=UPI0004F42A8E|nr:hypothetical protein DQ04_02891000 [Trypanosoma grayi]KEG11175.1 hypothetical protein DQ04_02891000 [Trypanosoma grayi]